MSQGQLLKVAEVAALWGVGEMTVRRAIWAGELAWIDIAQPGAKRPRIRIRQSAAEAYTASRERGQAA